MIHNISELADLGWHTFYSSQLDTADLSLSIPVKVIEVHRSNLRVIGISLDCFVPPFYSSDGDHKDQATVGDWLLLDIKTLQPHRLLSRKSVIKRQAAGIEHKRQLIAANVDTLFIVSSCNLDFNIPRLERYLVLATEANITPVIILTKVDLVKNPEDFVRKARKLQPGLIVAAVNGLAAESAMHLNKWCAKGQIVALLGSSGVGKSTLINTLTSTAAISTQNIRQDDMGRHTTTGRALHRLPQGGWLLDTPGMRELSLIDVSSGIDGLFSDIHALEQLCHFSNCKHETEPGCAILSAIDSGEIDIIRIKRWRKLSVEEVSNSKNVVKRRARGRSFSKMVKKSKKHKKRR